MKSFIFTTVGKVSEETKLKLKKLMKDRDNRIKKMK